MTLDRGAQTHTTLLGTKSQISTLILFQSERIVVNTALHFITINPSADVGSVRGESHRATKFSTIKWLVGLAVAINTISTILMYYYLN